MKPQPDLEPTMPRVLVAEDDTLVRIAIAVALRDAGFRVMEAASADEALAYPEAAERAVLVFSDMLMPGSPAGYRLARRRLGQRGSANYRESGDKCVSFTVGGVTV